MTEPRSEKTPEASAAPTILLTLGCDGRLYCHDLPVELLPVLAELCGAEPQLLARDSAGRALGEDTP